MDAGIVDEWHIWDFTRSQEDHEWVSREFGPVRYMGVCRLPAQWLQSREAALRLSASITNDLHIGILHPTATATFYELVIGGWNNAHSVTARTAADIACRF